MGTTKTGSLITLLFLLGFSGSAWCQQDSGDSIAASFLRYQSQFIQEKLFVHIDKSFYLAGENCWFSIYTVDGATNTPLSLSGIASIELLDKEQKPVLQERVKLDSGRGSGAFHLPASMPSGQYLFRAYTTWMKNFSADAFFSQALTIVNATVENPASDSARTAIPVIQFFPEGGNLVDDLSSVVAFKAIDRHGNGIVCKGVIYDQQADTLTHFAANRFGMGRFQLTPQQGHTYYARIETPAGNLTETLPAAYTQGYTMHVDDSDPHRLQIVIQARSAASSLVYLFVHAHRHITSLQLARLDNNKAIFTVDKDSLADGISHLTLFDARRAPVAERLWCKQPRSLLHIGIDIPASSYDSRSLVNVNLKTTDAAGNPIPASLSLSAILVDSLQTIPDENMLSYLFLSSDLKGKIESPAYYFTNPDAETAQALDNLLLTQGWTRFRWEDVLQNKKPYFEFLPETAGPVINAKITHRITGAPPPTLTCFLSIPGRQFQLASAATHADGSLNFHLDDWYGNKELIAQAAIADSNYRIDIVNSFSDRFATMPAGQPLAYKDRSTSLLSRSIAVQVENAYLPAEKYRSLPLPVGDTVGFYGEPTQHYNLDDFVRFVTMDEVIREYVEDVRVRWKSKKAYFRVRNALFNVFFDGDPLLLIDGVPVFDENRLLDMNPLKIADIDVVSHRYFLGPAINDGLVSFRSYDGDLGGYQLDPTAVAVQYNGLEQLREFYSPVYQTTAQTQSTLPDLRNQLLWSPVIATHSDGKKQLSLYTSDLKGNYTVIVQGITQNGLVGYSALTFTVR